MEIIQELAPGSIGVARVFSNLGILASSRDEWELAEQYHQRTSEITKKWAPGSVEMARTLGHLATLAYRRGELEQTKLYLERALEIQERLLAPDSFELMVNLRFLGNVARNQGELRLGAQYFDRSLKILETQLGKLRYPYHVKAGYWGVFKHFYRRLIELLLSTNRPEQAFSILERSRARSFLEMVAERELLFNADIPQEMQQTLRRIAMQHDRTQRQLAKLNSEQDEEKIAQLRSEFRRLRRERDDVDAQIRRASLPRAAVQYPQPLDLRGTRESLDPGTVMLYYSMDWTRSDLFVVTREDGLEVHSLPLGRIELRRDVDALRQLIAQARPDVRTGSDFMAAFERVSVRLGKALIEPAAERVAQSQRVLIVPDGPLHLLPFGALICNRGADQTLTGRDWHYLAEWKPLHTVLSATVYAELRNSRPRPGRDRENAAFELVAFGDPYYPPDLHKHREKIADVDLRSAVERGLILEPLPSTRQEIEGIAGFYPSDAIRIYLGPEATEEHAKTAGRGIRYFHFATHAVLDPLFPLNSGLVLSIPEETGEERDNGFLQVWEILEGLSIDADLVVLSACGSALGKEQGGEGLIGLTRAFQTAGARSVAATLWQVDDRVTAELMVRFHRHLTAGRSKDEALRAAQLELIRGPIRVEDETGQVREIDASAPHYWAAFQIFGDWR